MNFIIKYSFQHDIRRDIQSKYIIIIILPLFFKFFIFYLIFNHFKILSSILNFKLFYIKNKNMIHRLK